MDKVIDQIETLKSSYPPELYNDEFEYIIENILHKIDLENINIPESDSIEKFELISQTIYFLAGKLCGITCDDLCFSNDLQIDILKQCDFNLLNRVKKDDMCMIHDIKKGDYLSSGTYGIVYKIENDPDHVVKIFRKNIGSIDIFEKCDSMSIDSVREISCLQHLNHDQIIKIKGIYLKDSNIGIILDKLEKIGDLSKNIELKDALKYIHSEHIYHRDICPNNILYKDNSPILIDFGLAKYSYNSRGDFSPTNKKNVNYKKRDFTFLTNSTKGIYRNK